MTERVDYAREVKIGLADPRKLCAGLGLEKGSQRQATGLLVCCPVHKERRPSCSVTRAPDGLVRVRCFACDFSGDALSLVAACMGLRTRDPAAFKEILAEGAHIAGMLALEQEIRGDVPPEQQRHVRQPDPTPEPEADWPPVDELKDLWHGAGSVDSDPEVSGYLVGRKIDPVLVAERQLARCIQLQQVVPKWARYGKRSWRETGHRMLVRGFDYCGVFRSVRAWRVTKGGTPKRLPPRRHRMAGLVLPNRAAWLMLSGRDKAPLRLVVVEGEPDFLVWATRTSDGVIGLMSGSWSEDFAAQVPRGSEVIVRTHHDPAGDRYAKTVSDSLMSRCAVLRSAA